MQDYFRLRSTTSGFVNIRKRITSVKMCTITINLSLRIRAMNELKNAFVSCKESENKLI